MLRYQKELIPNLHYLKCMLQMSTENKKSHDDDTMDFNKLEKELAMAVEQDQRYNRENDAKFRAVHQKVGSYEEFRYSF